MENKDSCGRRCHNVLLLFHWNEPGCLCKSHISAGRRYIQVLFVIDFRPFYLHILRRRFIFSDAVVPIGIELSTIRTMASESELPIVRNAEHLLESFCQWQKSKIRQETGSSNPDLSILLTRRDICRQTRNQSEECTTMGLGNFFLLLRLLLFPNRHLFSHLGC